MTTRIARCLAALLVVASILLHAQDVTDFNLLKSYSYTQSTAGLPLPLATPYRFTAGANTATDGLLGGSIGVPGGAILVLTADGPDSWSADSSYRTSAALDADYPGGSYIVNFHTAHDGDKKLTFPFPNGTFPNAPQILTFQEAQSILPTVDFTAKWTPFIGGKVTDFVRFSVSTTDGQEIFKTRGYGKSGALDGSSTSATIPAGTLTQGQVYTGRVLFARGYGQNTDYGLGVTGTAAYYTDTQFPIAAAAAPDVKRFGVVKGVNYRQTGAGAPILVDGKPYAIQVFADAGNGGVLGGSIKFPNGTNQPFTQNNGDLGIQASYVSAAGLDADYPPGSYTVTLNTAHNGTQVVTLPLPASTFPNAPQLLNYSAAQAVNPTAAFTVSWNAFNGGGVNDFIQIQITAPNADQPAFQTPQPGQTGSLDGTATSATIPANTLSPGETYQVRLLFGRFVGVNRTYALGLSGYFSQTELTLATTGIAIAPTIAIDQVGPFQWHLHANGINGQNYLIESTTSLVPPISWQPEVNFNGSPSGFDFLDGVVHSQNFYRVRPAN